MDEFSGLQDMYDKTAVELAKTKDMEIKLKEDYERAHFDLEMCRERFDKCQVELRKMTQDKDKATSECDKLVYDLERAASQHNKAQTGLDKSQEEVARLQVCYFVKENRLKNVPITIIQGQYSNGIWKLIKS